MWNKHVIGSLLCVLLLNVPNPFSSVELNQGWLCLPGDIWQCLKTFSFVTSGRGNYWHLMGRGQECYAAEHPTTHRTASRTKNDAAQNAKVENLCSSLIVYVATFSLGGSVGRLNVFTFCILYKGDILFNSISIVSILLSHECPLTFTICPSLF